ncbi:MAG TPA: hypothetical protein DG754_12690 [Bacteroidales bacterium]|nr:hypothetical protein [Bacteroidales bacterium]
MAIGIIWVTISTLRLFSLSAKTPAKGVRNSAGICHANPITPNQTAESVNRYTNYPSAIF